jgi:uncharacterized protein (DUF1778 family)
MSEATAWVTAPVSPAVKRTIRMAAAWENCTVSEFLRRAALARATQQQDEKAGEAGKGNPLEV